ncbi:MAG: tyrosine-type recombinase/integrase [Planctomycetes bacterium]|nr:tyrosine-type recombinase/integrase [Planctomycetota bacterium]
MAGAITAVKRAFNWAADEGYIDHSPIARIKKPPRTGRGEEAYLMPDQWQKLVATVKDGQKPYEVEPFLDYITVMKETGCRPQEIRKVEARHLDHAAKRWVFPVEESKDGKKTKQKRIVELGDVAYGICQKLALKHPEGPLFRNSDGKPWTNYALSCRCQRLEEKLGFEVFPYAIRHTFATEAILNGVDVITIARLMGHSDLAMLNRIYQHVMRDKEYMQKARAKAIQRRATDAA